LKVQASSSISYQIRIIIAEYAKIAEIRNENALNFESGTYGREDQLSP
jgi:hypothetical protein